MKIMARLLNRNLAGRRARRMAARTTVVLPAVGPDGLPIMTGVSAVHGSATEVWAVGFTLPSGGGYHTFAIHHP